MRSTSGSRSASVSSGRACFLSPLLIPECSVVPLCFVDFMFAPALFIASVASEGRAIVSRGAVRDHRGGGAGTRLRRPPLATFEPTGTWPLVGTAAVPRCLSLLARRRLRRAPAPDGTRLDPDGAR